MRGFKICSGCGKDLPATSKYFYRVGRNKYGDALRGECKECTKQRKKKEYRERPSVKARKQAPAKPQAEPQPEPETVQKIVVKESPDAPESLPLPKMLVIDRQAQTYTVYRPVKQIRYRSEQTATTVRQVYEQAGTVVVERGHSDVG